jgi:hypothetical protein
MDFINSGTLVLKTIAAIAEPANARVPRGKARSLANKGSWKMSEKKCIASIARKQRSTSSQDIAKFIAIGEWTGDESFQSLLLWNGG